MNNCVNTCLAEAKTFQGDSVKEVHFLKAPGKFLKMISTESKLLREVLEISFWK